MEEVKSKNPPEDSKAAQKPSTDNKDTPAEKNPADPPVKIRKKPGRKPNPQSPAIRKAQNRAAQRAFRERKERHLRELEVALKQIKTQRDRFIKESNKLKAENDIFKAENWYLKGIVLTLQLVCYQNNLVIPQHSPYLNEPALSVLAQNMPECISAYLDVNAHNKLPIPSKMVEPLNTPSSDIPSLKFASPRERSGSIASGYFSTNSPTNAHLADDLHFDMPNLESQNTINPSGLSMFGNELSSINIPALEDSDNDPTRGNSDHHDDDSCENMDIDDKMWSENDMRRDSVASIMSKLPPSPPPLLQPSFFDSKLEPGYPTKAPPSPPITCRHTPDDSDTDKPPSMSAVAAIQQIRLKLRLQLITQNDQIIPPHIQPTILQLSIPHDPRIDLIPTAHMRDRMIIFRDQFDMDDCFNMLITRAVFHGGDPGDASSWELPADFFEKYWFLTINYDLKRTNRWRRLQGLNELSMFESVMEPFLDTAGENNGSSETHSNESRDEAKQASSSNGPSSFDQHFDPVIMNTGHNRNFARSRTFATTW
ncbi:unnamed protein product [Umbelopsis sp. WA50703]